MVCGSPSIKSVNTLGGITLPLSLSFSFSPHLCTILYILSSNLKKKKKKKESGAGGVAPNLSSSYRGHKKQKTIYDIELEARVLFDNFAQGPGSWRRPFFLLLPKDSARGSGATPCRRSSTSPASRHRRYCHHSFSRTDDLRKSRGLHSVWPVYIQVHACGCSAE